MQELECCCTNAVAFEHVCGPGACSLCLEHITSAGRTCPLAQVDEAGNIAEQSPEQCQSPETIICNVFSTIYYVYDNYVWLRSFRVYVSFRPTDRPDRLSKAKGFQNCTIM